MPTCWLGAMMPAMRLPSTTMIRAIDQDRERVALTIDDGPDPEVTPAVLDLLDELLA